MTWQAYLMLSGNKGTFCDFAHATFLDAGFDLLNQ